MLNLDAFHIPDLPYVPLPENARRAAIDSITFWIKDFDELQTVQIVPSMPGWMLRTNVAFRTEIPYRYVKHGIIDTTTISWGTFRPQPYTYMSEEELLEGFADLLDSRDRVS